MANDRKIVAIHFRITELEHFGLQALMAIHDLTISEMLRKLIRDAAKGKDAGGDQCG